MLCPGIPAPSKPPGRKHCAGQLPADFLAIEDTFKEKKAAFEKKSQEAGGQVTGDDGKVMKGPVRVAIRQDIVKSAFDQIPKEEQQKWQSKAEQDHGQRLEKWANSKELHFSTDPEERQRSIDLLHSWVMPLLEGIQGLTGLNVSMFCSGPIPADQGNINVLGMHCGQTIANPCETFGTKYQDQLRLHLYPLLANFCAQTHTLDECRWSSLGADAKLGKFFETDEVHLDGLGNEDRARFVAMTTSDTGDEASSSAAKPTASTSPSTSATTSSSSIPKSKPVETSSAAKPITSTSTSASTASTSSSSNSKSKAAVANPRAASSASTPPISILKSKSLEASSAATPADASSASIPSTSILKNKSVEMSSAKPTTSTLPSTSSSSIPKSKLVEVSSGAKPTTLTSAMTSSTSNPKSKSSAGNPRASSSASTPLTSIPKVKSLSASSAAKPSPASSASTSCTSSYKSRSEAMPSSAKPTALSSAPASTGPYRAISSRLDPRPPPVIPASSLHRDKGETTSCRALPVGGGAKVSTAKSTAKRLKGKTGQHAKERTAAASPLSPDAGEPTNPILLSSSPAGPTTSSKCRRISSPISISSTGSSPIPSPTRKARRMSSPSPSPSEHTATPHAPVRPETVRASSPPESSQPRLSLTPPPSTQPRGTKRAWAVDVKDEPDSPASSASMEEISLALAADAGSSPVKSAGRKKGKISLPISRPYVEISVPRKRARMSGGTRDDKRSRRSASSSSQGPVSVSAVERGLGKEKGKEKEKDYIVCLPDDCEGYMVRTMELCSRVASGNQEELWVELATAYVALEVVRNYKPGKLNTDGRPDLSSFKSGFQRWWWNIAPDWRRMDGEDAALLHGDGDWTVLYDTSTGPNGMSSVMAALAWWLDEVEGLLTGNPRERQLKEELEDWVESARDVLWPYNEMLKL
ncbi:SERTA domain-containing protein 3 [Marasmius crinis-equi]|uniref:SERTA domain-containing protein 3 n=1 Tax=Marasmius crinis-equi TaxID=585013 RepID=A0ABR3F7T6_9AGAR